MKVADNIKEPGDLTDEQIVERILGGEVRLFERIVRKYNARLYRIGMSIINDATEVEDIMQTAYVQAYEHLSDFRNKSQFGTWLTRILINESLLQRKRKQRNSSINGDHSTEAIQHFKAPAMQTPLNVTMNNELAKLLENALAGIPEKYRVVFALREMEDLSIAETVSILDISESNVKVRLNRAKTMLRDQLEGYYKSDAVYHFHLDRCDRIVNKVFQSLGI